MSPRKGNAHDHAYDTETLQEKADRIRAEQGLPPESQHSGPQPCHWYDDGHGGRFLIPGCMTRVINPDVEGCACKTVEEDLAAARAQGWVTHSNGRDMCASCSGRGPQPAGAVVTVLHPERTR